MSSYIKLFRQVTSSNGVLQGRSKLTIGCEKLQQASKKWRDVVGVVGFGVGAEGD